MSTKDSEDWLEVETPEDWLSTEPTLQLPAVVEQPLLGAVLPPIPDSAISKRDLITVCWAKLTPKQQRYIHTLRECRWNARSAIKQLSPTPYSVSKSTTRNWLNDPDYALCFKVLKSNDAGTVLESDSLLLRQDDIVEQLMTPTPILYEGRATAFFENKAAAASKANETLMKAAGLLKSDEHATRHVVRFVNLAGPEVQTAIEVATEIT